MYFVVVFEVFDLFVVIYNILGCSVVNIELEIIICLVKLFNIVGVKEFSGNLDNISKIIVEILDDF